MENDSAIPPKIECRVATRPNDFTSKHTHEGMERMEPKGHVEEDVCIHNSQKVDVTQMPTSRQKDTKNVCAHTRGCYSLFKRGEIVHTTPMGIKPNGISQTQKNRNYMLLLL